MNILCVLRWFYGWARVEAEGGFPERFLNRVAQVGVRLWGVRLQDERMRFYCFARDYRALRPCARAACVRMRVRRKRGFPFIVHRYRHHKGLLVGAALYAAILMALAPRIWVVDVVGCPPEMADEVMAQTEEMGVRVGARMADIDIKAVEITALDRLPMLSWITVNPSGAVARVEVAVREEQPDILDLSVPSNMVAVRDGQILSTRVVSGECRVMVGEGVGVGTVLIGGRVESEELGVRLYRAYGEVMAQTERQITVTVPLEYDHATPSTPVVVRPTLTFLGWRLPLYADLPLGDTYFRGEREHFLTSGEMRLPLGITTEYHVPVTHTRTCRTEDEALHLAEEKLRAREAELFADIEFSETARQGVTEEGAYRLTATYTCIENIAVEMPLQPDE